MTSSVGRRLEAARGAAGLSQPQIAAAIGVKQQQVSSWEHGTRIPDRHRAALAKALGVDLADLLAWIAESAEEDAQGARRDASQAKRDLEEALAQVKQFVDTYKDFHAAYQKIGTQVDQLVAEVAEIKRVVLRRNSNSGRS